jgi:hypothetical protein
VYNAASVHDGVMSSASFWDQDGHHAFGMRKREESSFYVVIDTGFDEAAAKSVQGVFSSSAVELDRGRIDNASLLVFKMKEGDDLVYCVAGNRLIGLSATAEGLESFSITNEAEVLGAVAISEGMRLLSLEGDKAHLARQAGAHLVMDSFKGGADGGEEALDALMLAHVGKKLDRGAAKRYANEISPRLASLAEDYGWPMKKNGSQVILTRGGFSHTAYLTREKPTRQQLEARRQASRAERLANRPKGAVGGTDPSKGGKKKDKK